MVVRRGEIYLVDFGIPKGSEQGGYRPALVIQNDIGNANSSTTIVAAITSKKKSLYPFHVEITSMESGLRADSTILLEQLLTISINRLTKRIGFLSDTKMKEIEQALTISLGISSI